MTNNEIYKASWTEQIENGKSELLIPCSKYGVSPMTVKSFAKNNGYEVRNTYCNGIWIITVK